MVLSARFDRLPDRPIPRILVVDDDLELCEQLTEYLQPEGFGVDSVFDGLQGVNRALSGDYSLLIIMLTAQDEIDRILGLEIGADDCLAKPFNPRELAARIQAVLRRSAFTGGEAAPSGPRRIILGDVELDEAARVVRRQHREVELTSVEFDLLAFFMKHPVKVLEREEIVRRIFGRASAPDDRTIDVHISNLRKKLGRAADGSDRIRAIRGVGYIFVIPVKTKS